METLMGMEKIVEILKEHKLSKTLIRTQVLELLLHQEKALSLKEIEESFEKLDRVTLYRTLKTFENKGIIHKAVDGTTHPKYALCDHHCDEESHQDNHAHFHCSQCGKTVCLEDVSTPYVKNLPLGYEVESTALILQGSCSDCS